MTHLQHQACLGDVTATLLRPFSHECCHRSTIQRAAQKYQWISSCGMSDADTHSSSEQTSGGGLLAVEITMSMVQH